MDEELVVDLGRDGADFPRRSPSGHLVLRVAGTVSGLDLSGLAWRSIVFEGGPWWPGLLPGRVGRAALRRLAPGLRDCDLSGMRTKHLDLGPVRFEGCRFERLDVRAPMGTRCALRGCTFSGRFEGNVSARAAAVEGNDFRAVVGLGFRDGVDWRANRFDLGRSQLVLQAGTGFYRACEAMEGLDGFLDGKVGSLSQPRRGPVGHPGQDWVLLQESSFPPRLWERLLAVYDGPLDAGAGRAPAGPARPAPAPPVLAPGADLAGAGLLGMDLAGADLRGAVLRGADLRTADLAGSDLVGADLADADAREAMLAGARLRGAVLRDAVLLEADLRGADLGGADLGRAELGGADAAGASFAGASLAGAGLRAAVLSGAVATDADLTGADLRGADFTDAVLAGADLTGADLTGADLRGADFTGAVLAGAVLAGVRQGLSPAGRSTRWPEGFGGAPAAGGSG